ncbi:glyoxylase I 4 [Cryptomeria japonica]|uniref:glyoxylase I 4 n=1 Tax=Cryptomeria japonica TaxID=3369 RepID=UPI0025AD2505|nr:glyoxylase I 4 [Cryptomeria japonica]
MKSFTGKGGALPLVSLNHISLVCRSVQDSLDFYENVLGFVPIKRPGSFSFDGAWLFSYGIGIHLLQGPEPEKMPTKTEINPMDNHISFQCTDMQEVEQKLEEMNIKLVKRTVEEMGIYVDQLFFHDPDGFMIEVCNCENLPVVPLAPTASCSLWPTNALQQQRSTFCSAKADTAPLSPQMLRVP